jgi:hypothetical protein
MTGTTTPSIFRWDQMPSGGKEIASGSLTVHFPALAPGTPIYIQTLVPMTSSEGVHFTLNLYHQKRR